MKRYIEANNKITPPAPLVARTIAAGEDPQRAPVRRTAPVAALLAAVLVMGTMVGTGILRGGHGVDLPFSNQTETNGGGSGMSNPLFFNARALATPVYPASAPYPDESSFLREDGSFDNEGYSAAFLAWSGDRAARRNQPEGYTAGAEHFFAASAGTLLAPTADTATENRLYSPLSVYLALSMLAEVTEGESRAQILSLVGADGIAQLREQAGAVWRANYVRDGAHSSLLASSLWLNDRVQFNADTLARLAEVYYASSYCGEMGSEAMNSLLQAWLNDNTGGLLRDYVGGVELDARTVLALAMTVYYQAKWSNTFSDAMTETGTFHGAAGDEQAPFMHKSAAGQYYWHDSFAATSLALDDGAQMWLFLPDEGVSADALLTGDTFADLCSIMANPGGYADSRNVRINLALPRFDVSAELDLSDALQALGVVDVFDPASADFSPMLDGDGGINGDVYLSQAKHAARVTVDEEGCTAAAYTVMMLAGNGMPPADEVDLVLDRPFVFVLTGADHLPMFAGVVNRVG